MKTQTFKYDCSNSRLKEFLHFKDYKNHYLISKNSNGSIFVGRLKRINNSVNSVLTLKIIDRYVPVSASASCLIEIDEGDLVKVISAENKYYVLAVLEKNQNAKNTIHLNFKNLQLEISSNKINFNVKESFFINAESIINKAHYRINEIKFNDRSNIGNSLNNVSGIYSFHSKSTLFTSQLLMKIDAAQIHMG